MNEKPQTISIHALFDESGVNPNAECDPRAALHLAELIFSVDVMTRQECLVYGKDTLGEIMKSSEGRYVPVLRIELDQETDELERLIALVLTVKGKHDYNA